MTGRHSARRDVLVTALGLVALLCWDFSGADRVVTAWFGSAQGFALRDNFWTSTVGHEGGRLLAWVLLLALVVQVVLSKPLAVGDVARRPSRADRVFWLLVTLLCLLVVPSIKRFSATSCPWDLAEYGGAARHLSHWAWGVADGGPGHCFPSGHAVGAFAFFSLYFLWRGHNPARARGWLVAVLVAGFLFGLAQLARGAHHASHSAWSAWICWALCLGAQALRSRKAALPAA